MADTVGHSLTKDNVRKNELNNKLIIYNWLSYTGSDGPLVK
jgi:hypothetical protein